MLSDEITECPHCGDTESGYRYTVTQKYIQNRGFGNKERDSDADGYVGVDKHSACRCNNCNKIIKS